MSINRPEFLRPAPIPRLNELANGEPLPSYMVEFFASHPYMAEVYRRGDFSLLDSDTRETFVRVFVENMALGWAQTRVSQVLLEDLHEAVHPQTTPPSSRIF